MSNEIEIHVVSKDDTGPGFASVDAKVKGLEAKSDATLGRVKEKFSKAGTESGKAFTAGNLVELEKGLAKAEKDLGETKKRLDSSLVKGDRKQVIEYDIRVKQSAIAEMRAKIKAESELLGATLGKGIEDKSGNVFSRMGAKFSTMGEKLGLNLAEGTSAGFESMINPMTATIGGLIVAGLLPIIGAGLATGFGLLAGAGIIGAGIAAAVKSDPTIGAAFGGLAKRAQLSLAGFGKSFAGPVHEAIGTFSQIFDKVDPMLDRLGARFGPLVSKLATGLAGAATSFLPGFESLATKMSPLFDELAKDLPGIGQAVGDMFSKIGEGSGGALLFFKDLINAAEGTIEAFGTIIEYLSKAYSALAAFRHEGAEFGKGFLHGVTLGMVDLSDSTDKVAASTEGLKSAETGMAAAATTAANAIQNLYDKLVDAGLVTLSNRAAVRQWEAAIDDVTVAVKKNGHTLDVNTAAGRANQEALDNVAHTGLNYVRALVDQHASLSQVTKAQQAGTNAAFVAARQMGMSGKAAAVYAAQLFGIPVSRNTLIQALGAKAATALVQQLTGAINSLSGKTVHIKTVFTSVGQKMPGGTITSGYAHGGAVGAAANGGAQGGLTWVGEQGPELASLAPGSQVHTAGDSRRMASSGGRGGDTYNVTIHNHAADPNGVVRAIQKWARDNNGLRIKGGVVAL